MAAIWGRLVSSSVSPGIIRYSSFAALRVYPFIPNGLQAAGSPFTAFHGLVRLRPSPKLGLTDHKKETKMPEKQTLERAQEDAREGKSPSTQAGEFVREEIHHVREGKHGVRNPKQAIAIGLSKARKAGVKLPPPPEGTASAQKESRSHRSRRGNHRSDKRSRATERALKREGRSGASHRALSRQAKSAERKRSGSSRSQAARKAARTRRASRLGTGG